MVSVGSFVNYIIPELNKYYSGKVLSVNGATANNIVFNDTSSSTYLNITFNRVDARTKDVKTISMNGPKASFYGKGIINKSRGKYVIIDLSRTEQVVKSIINAEENDWFINYDESVIDPDESGLFETGRDISDSESEASTRDKKGKAPSKDQGESTSESADSDRRTMNAIYQDATVQTGDSGIRINDVSFDEDKQLLKLVAQIYNVTENGDFSYEDKFEIIGETADLEPTDPEYVAKVRKVVRKVIKRYKDRKLTHRLSKKDKKKISIIEKTIPIANRRSIVKRIRDFNL